MLDIGQWWDETIGTDWGSDPTMTGEDVDAGKARYIQHLTDMQNKQGWPQPLVSSLIQQSEQIASQSNNLAEFWPAINAQSEQLIISQGYTGLPKISSHLAFLSSVSDSAVSWQNVQETYSPTAVAGSVGYQTLEDLVEAGEGALDPKKSIWPWIAALGIGVFVLTSYWGRK